MNIHHLRGKAKELRASATAILDKPAGTDGTLTDEQDTEYRATLAELQRFQSNIDHVLTFRNWTKRRGASR